MKETTDSTAISYSLQWLLCLRVEDAKIATEQMLGCAVRPIIRNRKVQS